MLERYRGVGPLVQVSLLARYCSVSDRFRCRKVRNQKDSKSARFGFRIFWNQKGLESGKIRIRKVRYQIGSISDTVGSISDWFGIR